MNLLVTGAWNCSKKDISALEAMGHKVWFQQYEWDELSCPYDAVEGVICNGLFLHHSIDQFVNLKYIQLTSAGFDRVPMEYVEQHQIKIHNARGVYSIPMAEFAITGVLQLYKQSQHFFRCQQAHIWEKHRGLLELAGKTVCVVGCGSVGGECAKRFAAFGCNVVGVDLHPYENTLYREMVPLDGLDQKLRESDVVVLTLPLTEQTNHLFDELRFLNMKLGSVLVNIARGAVVDTAALATALHGRLYGAVLDVFEEEPLGENSPLWDMENVILTPHNSFVGEKNIDRLTDLIIDHLEAMV